MSHSTSVPKFTIGQQVICETPANGYHETSPRLYLGQVIGLRPTAEGGTEFAIFPSPGSFLASWEPESRLRSMPGPDPLLTINTPGPSASPPQFDQHDLLMQAVDTTQLQSETITTLKAETKTLRAKVLDTRLSLAAREADCWLLRQALREIEAEPEASPKVREQATASLIRVPDPYLYQQPKAEPKAGAGAESKADDENILATALAKSLAQGKL